MASLPLTHPIVSAGSPGMRKRWQCRSFASRADDSSDDNDDDGRASRHPQRRESRTRVLPGHALRPCLRIRGSVFIRSASATPVVACALNPQNESSSSSLTSPNVSVLTSPQLHTRKVAGSIPAGTTQNLPKSQAMLRRSTVGHRFRHGKDFASSTSPSAHFRARSSASTTG